MRKNIQNWFTPDVSDRRSKNSKQQGLSNQIKACHSSSIDCKVSVNPRWVECLMGVPVGWTSIMCDDIVDQCESEKNRIDHTSKSDECRLLGNGVVPSVAAKAFSVLLKELNN